jgi:peroxiredoxin
MTDRSDQLVRRASVALSAGLAVMVIATAAYIVWPRIAAKVGVRPASAASPAPYAAGQQVDVPAAWYAGAPHTLILFARASCAACEKAQPFLKEIVGHMRGHGTSLMAHPPAPPADDKKFADSLGLTDDAVMVTTPGLRVRATPTIVLVDRQGRIVNAWEGAGKIDTRLAIRAAIDALPALSARR